MAAVSLVRVEQVTVLLGARPVLRAVDAEFRGGTVTSLEGPNGAGKSSLLAVLGTAVRPTRGRVVYEPSAPPAKIRAEIGWLSHESRCYPELTARENVELAAALSGGARGAWEQAASRVGAEALGARRFSQLSRGQRQRVALARAIAHRPSLLLLDEPWTGLDLEGVARLERVVEEERARGAVVVLVTHDPGAASRLGARRLRLSQGRLSAAED